MSQDDSEGIFSSFFSDKFLRVQPIQKLRDLASFYEEQRDRLHCSERSQCSCIAHDHSRTRCLQLADERFRDMGNQGQPGQGDDMLRKVRDTADRLRGQDAHHHDARH